jgi:hypothetical protein
MFFTHKGEVTMEQQRELAKQTFVSGVNSAKEMAMSSKNNDGFLITVLADLMQIQCIKSGDTNLLRFALPSAIDGIVRQIAKLQNVSAFTWSDQGGGVAALVFKNEDEQDQFIQVFEMLSFRGQRAYPTPDIYLGQGNPDQKLCSDLLEFLNRTVQGADGSTARAVPTHKKENEIAAVFVGAIHLEAKISEISEFGVVPQFAPLPQPTRCYLVGYGNGYWKFFWSKPGQFGDDANFITGKMKEDPSRNGERYFNDAIEDVYTYSTTLTLTTNQIFDGRGFMYKQVFSGWTGAFMGAMNPVDVQSVPQSWMVLFMRNAP